MATEPVTSVGAWKCGCSCHACDGLCWGCEDNRRGSPARLIASGPIATDPRLTEAVGYLKRALTISRGHREVCGSTRTCVCGAEVDELINESLKALRGLGED